MSNVANSRLDTTVQTILFDMDGTLLDLAFDFHIWLEQLPQRWAEQNQCELSKAQIRLYQFYLEHQGQLTWYSTAFWQQQLNIDMLALQQQYQHRIQARPDCFELLDTLKQRGIECWLVTNADRATLNLKLAAIPIASYFKHIVSSEDIGYPKEQQAFWHELQRRLPFNPKTSLFVDDNYQVLASAQQYGLTQVLSISQPDSLRPAQHHHDFIHLDRLTDLLDFLPEPLVVLG